ncbi:MAG: hypothetical protein CVU56_07500 [Deltaproteobacteria bacterium HGW-Deltaproteobacteria-14]|jgi:outer membrane protein OmpA-like peptidoglycan-associated protein|nr:MAG: hypothetical protein CVU56_07500 [Deltaproteobacteria bacterium HGW-Deltaproteobacteria-14]
MRRRLLRLCVTLLTLALVHQVVPASARPFEKPGSVEVALQLGGLFFLDHAAVPFDSAGPAFPEDLSDTFAYTLSGTYNITRMFGVELALQLAPAEVNRLSIFSAHLDFIVHPLTHDWFVPFFGIGPSFSTLIPQDGDFASDADPGLNVVAGLKLFPWDNVGFRVDVRYLARFATASDAPDGRAEVMGHDLLASFGLLVNFGGAGEAKPILLDTDGDGFLDTVDACPTVPGVATADGCPDKDGDTVTDAKDACPDDAGDPKYDGCPDKDGDTIVDKDDRCPDVAGPPEHKGCPDTDGDTIADLDDRCPKIPGEAAYQGCPPPPPEDVVKRFSGSIAGITFDLDSDVIRESSFAVLDEAVKVMVEYKQLRLLIEGHTSSEGTREHNLDLSARRAASVKAYLVAHEVAADRLETQGFGPDRPVASNDTEADRERNRRIEFKILRQ